MFRFAQRLMHWARDLGGNSAKIMQTRRSGWTRLAREAGSEQPGVTPSFVGRRLAGWKPGLLSEEDAPGSMTPKIIICKVLPVSRPVPELLRR